MRRSTLLFMIVGLIASSNTLWLFETRLKYAFFVFEFVIMLILYHSLSRKIVRAHPSSADPKGASTRNIAHACKRRLAFKGDVTRKLDYALFVASLTQLALTASQSNSILNTVSAIIVCLFLPGYVALRLLRFRFMNTSIEWLVLAFLLSIPISSLVYTPILILLPLAWRSITLSMAFVLISLVGVVGRREHKETGFSISVVDFDLRRASIVVIVALFFIFTITMMYPQIALLPGLDIVQHYSGSLLINSAPDLYASNYPWFNLPLSAIDTLSCSPIEIHQTSLAYLSLMLILSFYVMAHAFLKNSDKRLPALATAIWALFSGFGWVYILGQKVVTTGGSMPFSFLMRASDATYWDTSYGQGPWLWLWFRPITLGFIFMFTLLYLLTREDIQRDVFLFMFSVLVTSFAMVHLPELFLLSAAIFLMGLLKPAVKLRIRDASLSTFFGILIVLPLLLLYHGLVGFTSWFISFNDLALLLVISVTSCILTSRPKRSFPGVMERAISAYRRNGISILIIGSLLIFFILFGRWVHLRDTFSINYVAEIMAVPSFVYPVLLGIVGVLALIGFALVLKTHVDHPIMFFVCMSIAMILLGKAITIINANFFNTGYWERRVIPVLFSASCLPASLALVKIVSKFNNNRFRKTIVGGLVVFLVMSGLTSTFASIEFWTYNMWQGTLTQEEVGAISHLHNADPRRPLLTLSHRSFVTARYVPLGWIIDDYRCQLWSSKNPELPLSIFSSMNNSAILFVGNKDLNEIVRNSYADGYIASHLLNLVPKAYSNTEVDIFEIPRISCPSPSSGVVLALCEKDYEMDRFAYDILSLGNYNYTVAMVSDFGTMRTADVLIFPREDSVLEIINSSLPLGGKKIVILNFDGYGYIAGKLFNNSSEQSVSEHKISSQTESIDLPGVILVQPLKPSDSGEFYEYKVLANYEGESEVPFAVSAQDARGFELIYLNVYPLIQKLLQGTSESRQTYPTLGELLRLSHVELPSYQYERKDPVRGGVTTFAEARLKGDVTITSSFVQLCNDCQNITVQTHESSSVLTNVHILSFLDFESIEVRTSEAEMQGGMGFYSSFTVDDPAIILSGQTGAVVVSLGNGTTLTYTGKDITIQLDCEQMPIIARLPELKVRGISYFRAFYALGELNRELRTLGQNLTVDGEVVFFTEFGDSFTVTRGFDWEGSFTRSTPFLLWDEGQDVAIVILVLALVCTLFIVYDLKIKRSKAGPSRSESLGFARRK